jgi:hypothetical protein
VIQRRFEREFDLDDAIVNVPRRAITRIEKALNHLVIAGQHPRVEDTDAGGASDVGEPFEQPGPVPRP